jgi:glycerol-3-phosphate dehydrogenase
MVGTTDDEYRDLKKEPLLESQEIGFLLDTLRPYLARVPERSAIKSGFGGLRPLIASSGSKATKKLVRDHEVEHDEGSNLLSLLGGKWTTYRLMAKDTIDDACKLLNVDTPCSTEQHYLVGGENYHFEDWQNIRKEYQLDEDICQHLLHKYGNKAREVLKSAARERLHPEYPFIAAEVIYTVQEEMACMLRDFFARRIRLELLDWQTTYNLVPKVAELMGAQLQWTEEQKQNNIEEYQSLLKSFMTSAGVKQS